MVRPPRIDATVVCAVAEPRFLAARTARWLSAAGLRPTVKRLDDLDWARRQSNADRPQLWVAAGCLAGPRGPAGTVAAIAELAAILAGQPMAIVGERAGAATLPSDELHAIDSPLLLDWSAVLLEPKLARRFGDERQRGASFATSLRRALSTAQVYRQAPLVLRRDGRLRVLELITSLQRGGAERLVLELTEALRALDLGVELATTGRATRGAFDPTTRVSTVAAEPEAIERLASELGCDVVHAHLLPHGLIHALGQRGLPLVVTVHNARAGWPRGLAEAEPDAHTLHVACSQSAARDLDEARLPIRSRMVWNGIPKERVSASAARLEAAAQLRASLGLGAGDRLLLTVANPRRQKRFDRIPAALAEVHRLDPPRRTVWAILGEQGGLLLDARHAEAELAAALGSVPPTVREALVRLPPLDDVAPALHAADVVVSVSDWEGLSLAHLEALAAGRPLVATAAGGTVELAAAAPDLTLVPVDADATAIARAILSQPATTGASERLVAARFSTARMAERYRPLFDYAAARGSAAPQPGLDLCLVINNFSVGGAQSSARRLLAALHRRGYRVMAITVEEQPEFPTEGARRLAREGVRVEAAPAADLVPIEAAMRPVLRWLGDARPRAVLLWNLRPAYKVRIADAAFDLRLFDVSPGEMNFQSLERFFARPTDALPYATGRDYGRRLAGAIVKYVDERAQAEAVLGIPVSVIANGVPLGEPVPIREGVARSVGTTTRLSPQKRLVELIDAVAIARQRAPLELRIAGDVERGAEGHDQELRERAARLGVPLALEHGLDDVTPFLRQLDLFALIAEPPGCPNASLEALALGLPVVATDVGGMREQILDGETGLLTPRNDPRALGAALAELALDAPRRARLAGAGHAHVATRFALDRMVDDYVRACL